MEDATAATRVRRRRRLAWVVGAVVVVTGLVYGAAWELTPYSGVARAVAWMEADTGDIARFPARTFEPGPQPRPLKDAPADQAADLTVAIEGRQVALGDLLRDTGTNAFLVARGDVLLDERYFGAQTATTRHTSFSVAKSFLSTVVGGAVDRGLLRLDDPITTHVPELARRDRRFADITLGDLLTMSSGLRYEERSLPWSDDALTYYAADLRRLAITRSTVEEPPGRWHYNNYNPLLVALILERATGRHVTDLLEEWIWQPTGMEANGSWSLDSARSGFEKAESGLNAVPRDYLRFGMLIRDGGAVGDRRVLSSRWVRESTTASQPTSLPDTGYGAFWWTGGRGAEGHISARGNHGQFIVVFPGHDLVIVRLGARYGLEEWMGVFEQVATHYADR